jgi:hypothetical protein
MKHSENIKADFEASKAIANRFRPIKKGKHGKQLENFISMICFGASECWYWRGAQDHSGYGYVAAKENRAHRLSWVLFKGEIPEGMKVLHKCDNPFCVNSDHLFLGTQKENVHDMIQKGRHRMRGPKGELNGASKMTAESVEKMRRLRQETSASFRSLASEFGVSTMTACRICNNQLWRT